MKNNKLVTGRLQVGATTLLLLLLLLLPLLLLLSCQEEKKQLPQLFGQWQGKAWYIEEKPADVDASQVTFEFTPEGAYSANYGDQTERGTWYTRDDKLYTTAEGRQEIMTRIIEVNETDLKIEMNRAGRKERLELIKK